MELFTLGAGRGYTERRRARAGARADRLSQRVGRRRSARTTSISTASSTTRGVKRILGKRGRFDWRDSCRLCLTHRSHPSFFVEKLWSYFIPAPPGRKPPRAQRCTSAALRRPARVEAILRHPRFYEGPRMVKPPVVYLAGLCAGPAQLDTTRGPGSDTDGPAALRPPNVAGWDDARWLDSGTWRGRWHAASEAIGERRISDDDGYRPDNPKQAVDRARRVLGNPTISNRTRVV